MLRIYRANRVPSLASSLKRPPSPSFCDSTITGPQRQTSTSTSISEHTRRLHISAGVLSRKDESLFGLSSQRSFSQSSSPRTRMSSSSNNNNTATDANGSSEHTTKNYNSNNNGDNSTSKQVIYFGPFEVTNQVFLKTSHSFALVNLKPLLPGHVLVCPLRPAKRLTDLSVVEVTDLFSAVQKVQRMLARYYFSSSSTATTPTGKQTNGTTTTAATKKEEANSLCTLGSFNIAVQDGPEAGQTVSHVHVHVIPRIRGSTAKDAETPSDELYDRMAGEDGNVGGAQWDRLQQQQEGGTDGVGRRPEPGGQFPGIEDSQRLARGMEEMEAEAEIFRGVLRDMEVDG